jgi:hypothetical protein
MGKVSAVFMAIVTLVFGLMFVAGVIPNQITDFITDDAEESFSVTTGVGETEAIVTLSEAHYPGDTSDLSAESDSSTDTAVIIMDYDSATREVTLGSLAEDLTRVVTVSYLAEGNDDFDYINDVAKIIVVFIVIALLVLAVRTVIG